MSLSFLTGEEEKPLNEHEIAWKSGDWEAVKKLVASLSKKPESEFFYVLNQINNMNRVRVDTDTMKSYNPYSINQALSKHIDCVYHTYVMNLLGDSISDQMHFDYLHHAIRPSKRYNEKAFKNPIDEIVDCVFAKAVAKFYEVSLEKAEEYIELDFNEDQIKILKTMLCSTIDEPLVKSVCPYAKKAEITAALNIIKDWNKQ